ncbi:MAG: hypothetical protein K0S56_4593 [Microvirga sp.]|jgi:hypothetical protein|nr:hypothetical protein [Microvirga sp.]
MRIILFLSLAVCSVALWPPPAHAALVLDARFGFADGELTLTLDGRQLARDALVGQTVVLRRPGDRLEIRIDGIDLHGGPSGRRVPLYRLSARADEGSPFTSLCKKDGQGREAALAVVDSHGQAGLTCTSGAEGKCILFGYRPWEKADGVSLLDAHLACIRMLRADYGGDDLSHTRDGTLIAFRDRHDIHDYPDDNQLAFEAAWGPDGALCVAHTRIGELMTLDELARRYPALVGRLGPDACKEDAIAADPRTILFNRSRPGGSPAQ